MASAAASEMDDLVGKLASEDFDTREQATSKLAAYPEEYAKKFLDMSHKAEDPEVAYRLRVAAKAVYTNRVVVKSNEFRYIHGEIGIIGQYMNIYDVDTYMRDGEVAQRFVCSGAGYFVNIINDGAKEKIHDRDVIMSMKGIDGTWVSIYDMQVMADAEYDFTLRRYKDPESVGNNSQGYIDNTNKDFEEITVRVKAGWKEDKFVDHVKEFTLIERSWNAFWTAYEKDREDAGLPKKTGD